jgi:hypothetical protein
MTIINKQHNYIFVHVPKAAGKSIKEHLLRYSYSGIGRAQLKMHFALEALSSYASASPVFSKLVPPLMWPGVDERIREYCQKERIFTTAHLRADQLIEILGEQEYRAMYSFSFVRNPWDRCLSAYFYFRRKRFHPLHKLAKHLSYEDFLTEQEQHGMPYVGQQTQWLYSDYEEKQVSFIGRVERIGEDIEEVGRNIDLPHHGFASHTNVSESRDRDYRCYYTPATVDIVARSMRSDIDLLGYEFE